MITTRRWRWRWRWKRGWRWVGVLLTDPLFGSRLDRSPLTLSSWRWLNLTWICSCGTDSSLANFLTKHIISWGTIIWFGVWVCQDYKIIGSNLHTTHTNRLRFLSISWQIIVNSWGVQMHQLLGTFEFTFRYISIYENRSSLK